MNAQTERFTLTGAAGAIEALRDRPVGTPRGVAVIAHPHPLYGGTMDNKVVQTLARAFVQSWLGDHPLQLPRRGRQRWRARRRAR